MPNQLSLPLPILIPSFLLDEILFSWGSRYHLLSGNPIASDSTRQLFGDKARGMLHDFPCRLKMLEERTQGAIGTATELAKTRTILPFYLPFRPAASENAAFAAVNDEKLGSLKYQLGLLTSIFRANHPLKACLVCMDHDRRMHGTAYWHLTHQYPGVWTCGLHETILLESTVKSNGVGRFNWFLPDQRYLVNMPTMTAQNQSLMLCRGDLHAMSAIVSSFVSDLDIRFDLDVVRDMYRSALVTAGFAKGSDRVDIQAASVDFVEAVRPLRNLREFAALPQDVNGGVNFLMRMTRPYRSVPHPLRHLCLIYWLFGSWSRFMSVYRLRENVQVVTDISEKIGSDEQHRSIADPRKDSLIRLVRDEARSARSAASTVGIDMTTAMTWLASAGIATKRRPKIIRGELRERLLKDLAQGVDKQEAAARYEVSIQSVTTTLRTEPGLNKLWQDVRQEKKKETMRHTWRTVVAEHGEKGVKHLRSLAPAPYAWLYRNDAEWLKLTIEDIPLRREGNHRNVDWSARDQDMARKVRSVALQIHKDAPGVPIRLPQLRQHIPELRAKWDVMNKLPLTQQAVKDVCKIHVQGAMFHFFEE